MDLLHQKFETLKSYLRSLGSVVIAYSGGVDSTFLLKTAFEVLGEKTAAVTVSSFSFPKREQDEAAGFCRENGIPQFVLETNELEIEGFRQNPPDRCYICKRKLFGEIKALASKKGFLYVAEGSNMDDSGDYRPGLQAITELGILSPLRQAELYKAEIRELSKEMGLPTWNKPSCACLASRFVYGELITEEKLKMVDKAEQFLLDLGFRQMRVRIHGSLARIEVEPEKIPRLVSPEVSSKVVSYLKSLGFTYVSMDLQGYRTGSMNEVL